MRLRDAMAGGTARSCLVSTPLRSSFSTNAAVSHMPEVVRSSRVTRSLGSGRLALRPATYSSVDAKK